MRLAIASTGGGAYSLRMISRAVRLLALIALVLMPFTMAAAPAEAHAKPQGMGEEHCGDHQAPDAPRSSDMAQCMLMCAALPAGESIKVTAPQVLKAPRQQAVLKQFQGVILEIATPPPRIS